MLLQIHVWIFTFSLAVMPTYFKHEEHTPASEPLSYLQVKHKQLSFLDIPPY
jgi:hypothetical protein